MSTIENNTEELQEILETVNNLPNLGGTEYDLVIVMDLPYECWDFSAITQDHISYIGDFATIEAKLLNGENINVILKHEYHHNDIDFSGTATPLKTGRIKWSGGGMDCIFADFLLAPVPGHMCNYLCAAHFKIDRSGEIDFYRNDFDVAKV